MTTTETVPVPPIGGCTENALRAVRTAGDAVTAAKRTGSIAVIARAQSELQAAVDVARDLDVQWGQIGSTLGMARGNAYQRFRKKAPCNDCRQRHQSDGQARISA